MEEINKTVREDEIDLIELAKVVWSRRLFIAKVTGVFVFLGLVIAFTAPDEYETSCILIPEAMEGSSAVGGRLGGLASLAGIDLGGGGTSSTINPGLYRSVAQSTPFLVDLMYEKFYFQELDSSISLYDYYRDHYQLGLVGRLFSIPGYLIGMLKSNAKEESSTNEAVFLYSGLVQLTKFEQSVANDLYNRILVTMDWEINVVTIEVEMQDAYVAAAIAEFTRRYITQYVTKYSVSKSMEQLKFVQGQYDERKDEFEQAQLALASFRDENQYVNSARARTTEERLQSEYNLAYGIYNQLAKQIENIKMQVNESTPVFTVLEPVKVPNDRSNLSTVILMIVSLVLGMFVGIFLSLFHFFRNLIFSAR